MIAESQGSVSPHELADAARRVRADVVRMVSRSKSSHVGTALSCVDILVALYFSEARVSPDRAGDPGRDRVILSKGHGCTALYATLAERGFEPKETLGLFAVDNGQLWGHSTWKTMRGIEVSTGSLGHGLSIGVGMALAGRMDGLEYRTFVVLGDGECDEGSVWEAILYAGHMKLDTFAAIVDYNKIQSYGNTSDVLGLEPFAAKWVASGWAVREVDGHDPAALCKALSQIPFEKGKPSAIIAHTVKGKGVSFMENKLQWHYKNPDEKHLEDALGEIGAAKGGSHGNQVADEG